jgi:hypothetical protein
MADRFTFRWFLLKIALLVVYAGFFVVQLFINFDTTLDQKSDRYQVIEQFLPTSHTVTLERTQGHHPFKTKFRLNKSFQPAVVSHLPAMVCRPLVHLAVLRQGQENQPFITNPLRNTSFLRGPPIHFLLVL